MILEISGELSEQIESAARIRGTDAANFVIEAARRAVEEASPPSASEARRQAAAAGLGMFAGRGSSVDEFLAERHAEGEAEYEKWKNGGSVERDQL